MKILITLLTVIMIGMGMVGLYLLIEEIRKNDKDRI